MKKNNFGFTLIELLAVVLMIGILTSVALPQYRRSVQRAEAMEALVNLKTIFDSAKRYRAANSETPGSLKGLDVQFFDADPNSSTPIIGNYKYMFFNDHVSACRVDGKGHATADSTYCLVMYYKTTVSGTTYKDFLMCNSSSAKWNYVCESLAQSCPNGETSRSGSSYVISDRICD